MRPWLSGASSAIMFACDDRGTRGRDTALLRRAANYSSAGGGTSGERPRPTLHGGALSQPRIRSVSGNTASETASGDFATWIRSIKDWGPTVYSRHSFARWGRRRACDQTAGGNTTSVCRRGRFGFGCDQIHRLTSRRHSCGGAPFVWSSKRRSAPWVSSSRHPYPCRTLLCAWS